MRLKQLHYFHIYDIHRDVHRTTMSETFRVFVMRHFFGYEFLAEANVHDIAEKRINVFVPLDVISSIDEASTNDPVGSLTNLFFIGIFKDKFRRILQELFDDIILETKGK